MSVYVNTFIQMMVGLYGFAIAFDTLTTFVILDAMAKFELGG